MIASGAYHYLPEMKDRKAAIERLFDIELEYTFSTSEQAWAALVLALEIQDIQKFFKKWKTSREFAKTGGADRGDSQAPRNWKSRQACLLQV